MIRHDAVKLQAAITNYYQLQILVCQNDLVADQQTKLEQKRFDLAFADNNQMA